MKKSLLFLVAALLGMLTLQAQNTCVGPTNLTATPHVPDYRNVTLNWTAVNDPQSQTVALSNPMALNSRIGWSSGSAVSVVPVTRYTASDLTAYNGYQFTDVLFAPGVSSSFATFEVVIFKGGSMNPLDTTFTPGTLIYSQPVTTALTPGVINTIPLTAPITIDASQELWVGIHIIALYGYPIYVTTAADNSHHNQTLVGDATYTTWHPLSVSSGTEYTWCIGMQVTNNANRPQGYMVYRNMTPLTSSPIPGTTFVDSVDINGTIQYDVTALYASNCESTPISTTIVMDDDTCVIYDLPFTENFDSHPGTTSGTTNNLPECWHHIAGAYASYAGYPIIYNSSSYAASGTNSLRFYTTTTSTDYGYQVAILPPMDVMTYPMNTLQIEFDGRASATSSNFTLVVGVMDNYYDLSTFEPIDTFTSSSTSYTNFVTDFSQYTGNGAYIALMAPRNFVNNYGYIDNLTVYEIPTCPKPRDLALMSASQSSVSLTWNEMGTATEWEIEYGPAGFIYGSGTRVQALSNPATVTGLLAGTSYDFYVRSVCGYDDTSLVAGPFTTSTECGYITQLPYSQNFDAYSITNNTSTCFLPQICWTNISTGSSYSGYPNIYNSSSYSHSGVNSLRFYIYGSTAYSDQYAVMPALDPSIQMNTLMLEYKAQRYSTYPLHVIIGVMSDSSDVTTFVPVDTLLIPTTETVQNRDYLTFFNNYTGTGRFIAFRGVKPSSSSAYMSGTIDDVVLSYVPSCMHPMDLAITEFTSEDVTVTWQPMGSEFSWEVVVVPAGSSPESGIVQVATEYPFTVDMLTPQTNYDVYVRAFCGGMDYSTWAGPLSFQTRCSMTSTIPYVENFDTYGTATSTSAASPGPLPTCWTRYTNYTSPYPYISSTQHIGTGALYFYSTTAYYSMAVSQQLDLSNYQANELNLSFKVLKTSASYGRLQVGVMTNPDSMGTFVLLKNIYSSDIPNNTEWTEFNVTLPDQYTTPVYLAFRSPNEATSYVYLDDVNLEELPTCSEPRNLAVEQIQGTSAMVTWDESFFGTPDYVLQYSELGMDNWSSPVTVSGTRYMLSGLTPNTSYEVRIYSDCSLQVSDTVSTTFLTNCLSGGAVVFDAGTTTTYLVPLNNYYKYSYTQQIYLASEMNGPTDIKSISFDYAYATAMTAKTNCKIYLGHTSQSSFAGTTDYIPLSNLQLVYTGSLNCSQGWNTFVLDNVFHYNGTDNLVLAVDDNSNAYNSSSYVFHYQTQDPDYRTLYYYSDSYNTDPANPPAAGASVSRTYNRSNVKFGGDCDSVWVCAKPNVYVSSVNNTDVTIDWAAGDSESSWAVEYKRTDDYTWTSEGTVSTNTYTFNNLNTGTNYDFRVCALCSSTDSSIWSTVSAFVPCASISTLPYTQDFESATGSGSAHTVDLCLTRGTNSTTAYPYPSITYAHSGDYSLYFYGASSTYSYLALPKIGESIQMDSLIVQFQALKTSAAYYVEAGIMEDPDDISTFTTLATFSPSQNSTTSNPNWEMSDFLTNTYTGSGRYVAFRIPQAATSYIYLDDIVVDYMPSCLHVTNLHLNDVTSTTAEVAWTPGQNEQMWYYVYGLKDSVDLSTATWLPTTSNPLTLTGLDPNTEYDFFVAADCNEPEPSQFMKLKIYTTCDAISTIPYFENFDEYGGVSGTAYYLHCWSRYNTYSTTSQYPYLSTTFASAPQSLYFYSTTSSTPHTYSMAILNELAPSVNLNTLQARFKLRTSTAGYYMMVGVVTDPESPNSFVALDTVENSATATWEEFSVPFANYTGQGRYIAFKGVGALYFDDLWIEEIPNCDAPDDLAINGITTHGATISWTAGDSETEWQVYVFPEDSSMNEVTPYSVQNTPTLTLTSLEVATVYQVYLRAVCPGGTGYSSYIASSFTTKCDPMNILPYTEDFDGVQGTTSTTAPNNLPLCWSNINTGTSYPGYPIVYSNTTYSASGANSMRFYSYSSTAYSDQYAIMPAWDVTVQPLSNLQLKFDVRQYSTSYPFILLVGVMSDPSDATTFVLVDSMYLTNSEYETKYVYFDNYTGNGSYITFLAPKLSNTYNEGNIDNIELSMAPNCRQISNFYFEHFTSSSVDVVWDPVGSSSSWVLQYRELNGTDTTWMSVLVSGTPSYTLTSLEPNTSYEVMIQTDCGGGEFSDWSAVKTFRTECAPALPVPFFTNFDSYAGSSSGTVNNLPNCWHYLNTGTVSTYLGYPIIYNTSSYAASGTNSLRFYTYTTSTYGDEYAILPELDTLVHPMNTLQVGLDIRKYSTSYYSFLLLVGVMSDPYDVNTFVVVDSIVATETTYVSHTTYLNNYTAGGSYIAFKAPQFGSGTYNAGNIDNLSITLMPQCPPVRDVTISNITPNSAEVTWTPVGSETGWWVKYRANTTGATADSVYVTSTSYSLTNLTSNTSYVVQIQSDCGLGETSQYTSPVTFTTECSLLTTLPFSTNFDSNTGSTSGTTNNLPDCWHYLNTGTLSTYAGYPIIYNSSTYSSSGTNSLRFYTYTSSSTMGDQYAILPGVDPTQYPMNTLQIEFDVRKYSTSYASFTLQVGVMTDPYDISTFVLVDTLQILETTYSHREVKFNNYQGIGAYVTLMAPQMAGVSYNAGYIDNLVLKVIPCSVPESLAVNNVTATSATVTWTPSGTESAWNLQYKTSSATSWTLVSNITSPTYNLTNLQPNTSYLVQVQANCGSGTSNWTSSVSFTTMDNQCAAPTNLHLVDTTNVSATLDWSQTSGVANEWTVYYKKSSEDAWSMVTADAHPYVLTNLEAGQTYVAQVSAHCTNGMTSDPSGSITFTTSTVGVENYELEQTEVFPNPTTGQFRIQNTEIRIESVEVFDVYGKMMMSVQVDDNAVSIDATHLASGVYFARIVTEKGTVTKRIVKK